MRAVRGVTTARSLLFVPGDRPERFGKAAAAGADLVIVDLEDAVPLEHKSAARAAAADWLRAGNLAVVRIDSDPARAELDLAAVRGAPGLAGVIVPKAEPTQSLAMVRSALGARVPIIALIESAAGVAAARELAVEADRLAIGSFDLSLDLGVDEHSAAMTTAAFQVVLASRLAGLPAPIATVTIEIGDGSAAGAAAAVSRANGFGGKLCIHPVQVAAVTAAFRPTAEERDWARRVAGAGDGVSSIDGSMVDRPIIERALRILQDED